jgi:large subunit ribosomal protein L35
MPKLKTVKGVKDRIRRTASGRLVAFRAGRRHLLGHRRAKAKRPLRRTVVLSRADEAQLKGTLPY